METGSYNLLEVLKALNYAFASEVMTSTTSRPENIPNEVQGFIVVAVTSQLKDNVGAGDALCRISIYARDLNGYENSPELGRLQDFVYSKLPIRTEKYTIQTPRPIPDGPDGLGFHCWHIYADVFIK